MSGDLIYKYKPWGAESEYEMPHYTEKFKEQIVRKLMPPNALSVADVNRETGISGATLYNWRNNYRKKRKAVPADSSNPENWSGENKLAVVIETAAMNEQELSEYCRRKGLYAEQIARWSEGVAVGSQYYVEGVMEQLGIKATGRSVYHEAGLYQMKEPEYAYKLHFDGKIGALSENKGSFSWE